MADDRTFQYCSGFCGYGNDHPSEKECSSTGSQCSGRNFLLPWSNRAGNLWCKPEIRIPVYLWNDRICYFSSCLRYDFYNSQRSRCRWNPGNPVHSAEIYGKLCNLYGDCFCDSDDTDIYCWKEKTFHGRSSGSRGQRRYSGCISRSRQHQRNRKYRNNRT